jgi:retinol dehydrogenase 14
VREDTRRLNGPMTGPMTGRSVLVTGATGGIGRATALELASMGADVAMTGRDPRRTESAAREVRAAGSGRVTTFVADLSSQAEVRRLAAELRAELPTLHVLVNNAGGYWNTRHVTADGLERTFAVNYLAPFLLTHLVLDMLRRAAPARVVNVASHAHAQGRMSWADLQGVHSYSGARAYNQSKLALVLFTYELARHLSGTPVTVNALHPGVVSTGFGATDPGLTQRLVVPLARPFMRPPARGAAATVRLAGDPDLAAVSGRYFGRDGRPKRSVARSHDRDAARRLTAISAELVGLTAPRRTPAP